MALYNYKGYFAAKVEKSDDDDNHDSNNDDNNILILLLLLLTRRRMKIKDAWTNFDSQIYYILFMENDSK